MDKQGQACGKRTLHRQAKKTVNIEVSILGLRSLGWGTARIQQGLYNLPDYMLDSLPFECPQGIILSRSAINDVLTKHEANGYQRTQKSWKFFRASQMNFGNRPERSIHCSWQEVLVHSMHR